MTLIIVFTWALSLVLISTKAKRFILGHGNKDEQNKLMYMVDGNSTAAVYVGWEKKNRDEPKLFKNSTWKQAVWKTSCASTLIPPNKAICRLFVRI